MDDLTLGYITVGIAFFCFFGSIAVVYKVIMDVIKNDKPRQPKEAQS